MKRYYDKRDKRLEVDREEEGRERREEVCKCVWLCACVYMTVC